MKTAVTKLVKHFNSLLLEYCGFNHRLLIRYAQEGGGLILMYHRIIDPKESDYIEPGMYVKLKSFKKQMDILNENFRVVPLRQFLKNLGHPGKKPICAITFDDGWADFYTNAFPVLEQFKFPATVFLPTNFIGTSKQFWTERVALAILNGECLSLKLHEFAGVKNIKNVLSRDIPKVITGLKKYSPQILEQVLGEEKPKNEPEPSFLNWYQVQNVANSGIIEFGSHTSSHTILTTVKKEEIERELKESKNSLLDRKIVTEEFIPFCYPNGNTNDEICEIVRDCGYSCAVTTKRGWNLQSTNAFKLKRVGMHEDVSNTKALAKSRVMGKK